MRANSQSNKIANIIKQNWNRFLLVVTATGLKQQISKVYPQILSTEASFHIYDRPLTEINVIAIVCTLNLRTKLCWLLYCPQPPSLCIIIIIIITIQPEICCTFYRGSQPGICILCPRLDVTVAVQWRTQDFILEGINLTTEQASLGLYI